MLMMMMMMLIISMKVDDGGNNDDDDGDHVNICDESYICQRSDVLWRFACSDVYKPVVIVDHF